MLSETRLTQIDPIATGSRTDYYDLPTKRRPRGTPYKEESDDEDGTHWPKPA